MKQKHLILMFLAVLLGMFTMLSAQYFTESFEGTWTGTPPVPNGWTNTHTTATGSGSGTDPLYWAKNTWSGSTWSSSGYGTPTSPTGAYNGSSVAWYKDYSAKATQKDQLNTPIVDLSGSVNPRISFYLALNSYSSLTLKLRGSNDGGATWADIQTITKPGVAWTKTNVNIPALYKVTNAKFGLEVTASYGSYDIWIDSFVIEEAPTPISGTKTIGSGGDYASFTAAINALNAAGVASGGVTFNVADGEMFTEEPPVITATGSVSSPIVFQKAGTGANPTIYVTTSSAGIQISGGDYITFDGINIAINTGSTPSYGYYLIAAAGGTNGAQYNTIKNCSITLNKTNTSSKGIYQYYYTTPTNLTGTNSYNTYQNISIANSAAGIYLYGYSTASYADVGCEISNCTIGGASANDIGGSTTAYGVYANYQSGLKIFSNSIRNLTTSSYSSAYGIYLSTCYGENLIHSNKIYDVKVSVSTTSTIYGIYASLGSTLTNSAKIYNNMIWGISSAYTGSNSTSYAVEGIYLAGTGALNTYYVDFNSIRIAGPTTAQSAGVYIGAVTAKHLLRNNIIANYTAAQTSTTKHYCIYSPNASVIGIAGSISNNNVLYVDNATNGFIARGSSTDYATITAWNAATSQDSNSRPTNPQFTSATNLYLRTDVPTPAESRGSYFDGAITWVATDIDGARTVRSDPPDAGADEGEFLEEVQCETPENQPTNLVLVPYATSIYGSFTASDAEAYLVIRHTDATHSVAPVDETTYTAGAALGNGTVVSLGSPATFTATSLTADTQYYFTVYAYNVNGLNGPKYLTSSPLTGGMITLPAAPNNPATFTAAAASTSSITLSATANASNNDIMVAYSTTSSFGTPVANGYTVGGSIVGGGTVLYMGPASGLTTHTELTEATTYYYKAWSYIAVDRATYYSFSTGITANATTLTSPVDIPVNQDFESITTAGQFPAGWQAVGTKWNSGITPQNYGRNPRSGTDYITCAYSSTSSDWMFTRGMNLTGGSNYDFSIWYVTDGASGWTSLKMYAGTSQAGASMTTQIASVLAPTNTTYLQLTGSFTAPSSGVYYIGLQAIGNSTPWYITFDDFEAVAGSPLPLAPTTPSPATIATDVSINQNLGWTNNGNTTKVDVYFGSDQLLVTNKDVSTRVALNQSTPVNSYDLPTLLFNTTYYWLVVAKNDENAEATSDVWSFTTATGIAATPSPSNNATSQSITSILNWADVAGATGYKIIVGTSTESSDLVDGTAVLASSEYTHTTTWPFGANIFWKVITLNGAQEVVGTEWNFGTSTGIAITPVPANNSLSYDASSRTISWAAVTGASGYKVNIGTTTGGSDLVNMATVATNSYTYPTNWPYSTQIFWKVYTVNGVQEVEGTEWNFTTGANPTLTPPFLQDFATMPPTNWTRFSGLMAAPSVLTTTTSGWAADGFANSGSTGAARINIYGTTANYWLVTPPIDLGGSKLGYNLEFDLALTDYNNSNSITSDTNGTTGIDDKFAVLISTDGSTWTSANTLKLWDNAGSENVYNSIATAGEHVTIDLSSYSGTVKIAFYGESTVSNADNDLFIDNVSVSAAGLPPTAPTTFTPANSATGVAINTNLSWSGAAGAPTGYQVFLGTDEGSLDRVADVETSPYDPADNLLFGTTYYWYVSAYNDNGSDDSSTISFTTVNGKAITPSPANNATSVAANSKTLAWAAVAGATAYKIKIGTTAGGSDIANMVDCATNSYTHSVNWQYSTTYFWTVYTMNGTQQVQGDEWKFTTGADPNYGGGDAASTAGGYYFANNLIVGAPSAPSFAWVTVSENELTDLNLNGGSTDDGYWGPIDIGFEFLYYGNTYNQLYLSTNGTISFGSSTTTYSNVAIPTAAAPGNLIALFWDDLEYYAPDSKVYYESNGVSFSVTIQNMGRTGTVYNPASSVTAQAILYADGKIKLQYQNIVGTHSPTIGIENIDGTKGVQYHFDGVGGPYTTIAKDGIAVIFGDNPATLPVTLSSFTATFTAEQHVKIAWISESETDHAGYNIMRSEVKELATASRINNSLIDNGNDLGTQISYSYTDSEVYNNATYYYWLESVSLNGESEFHGPLMVTLGTGGNNNEIPEIPVKTELLAAFPNPFNPATNLRYSMKDAGHARLDIYNLKGQLVRSFENSHAIAGYYQVSWDGRDTNGRLVGTGVYFYKMTSGNYTSTKKMIMAK